MSPKIAYKQRQIVDIEIDGIDSRDYPDFCDAYFSHAVYADTLEPLTDDELEELTDTLPFTLHELCLEMTH